MKEKRVPKPPSIVLLLGRRHPRDRPRRSRLSRRLFGKFLRKSNRSLWVSGLREA